MRGLVVDALDEDVFESDVLLLARGVVGAGFDQLGERILAVHGHDLRAHFVGRAVQGDGEADLAGLVGELADLRGEAARGDGDVARAEADAPRGIDDVNRAHEVSEVREGLAHAHEDEVAHAFAGETLCLDELAGDFAGRKVARKAVEPARAKLAAIRAADLRADAERAAVARLAVERRRRGDEDGLDEIGTSNGQRRTSNVQ